MAPPRASPDGCDGLSWVTAGAKRAILCGGGLTTITVADLGSVTAHLVGLGLEV